ncbi:hypothetical protein C2R22_09605 [Salinigranum rubrum]|jgi:hypothetical protein|uniref:Uncharacterized protein n=1 Tax=Salinigranum rubrum TaxID=755307 RepID=A0A2I8VIW2_9EURY|nr:hypothetical protein [Salinigranum rubrum]AUV81872.1 hypothetical protein C2R22_09605 [Salinigranum rubrum]
MIETTYRAGLLVAYQFAVFVGILLMPIALLARRAGVTLPIGRLVQTLDEAYTEAADATDVR